MKILKSKIRQQHEQTSQQLDEQERRTHEIERRIQLLEAEAGIFRHITIREANGT